MLTEVSLVLWIIYAIFQLALLHCYSGEKNVHFCIYSNAAVILTVILNLKKKFQHLNIDETLVVKSNKLLKANDFYLFVWYISLTIASPVIYTVY